MRKVMLVAMLAAVTLISTDALLAQAERYPASRHGGNYMHNFYFPPAPSSTPWAPSWAPDGASVAVAMSGSIWRVDLETGVADELTYSPEAYHSSPDWSSDGRWIVYTADYDGARVQLELLHVDTGDTRALTDDQHVYSDPTFSPSGDRLSYVSTRPNGYFNVSVRPIDVESGRWAGDEILLTADSNFGHNRLYFGPWDMHLTPVWLPGGDELLLVSNRDVPLGSGNAVRVPAAEGGIRDATTVLREQTLFRTRPDVASDGKRFVYSSTRGAADQFNNLYVQPTVGGEPYKLTFFQHDAFHPRWSPDDEWIAFITNEGGLPQLALLETHGGEIRRIAITDRRWKRPMGVLSLRTRDSDTGQVTGARVHLTAADGKFYAPADAYARLSGQGDHLFHTSGTSAVELPVGEVELRVVKGFEYFPEAATAEITAGETTRLTVDLRRMTDMAAQGWYSASTHVHSNYGGNLHNTLENLIMMSEAEDQDLVLEQIANKDNRILDYQYFEPGGGPHTDLNSRSDRRGGTGVSPTVLRTRVHVRYARSPDLPVHDGIRGYRHREPLPEQHRHVPQGEDAGGNSWVCARVRRRARPARRHPRRRQGLHGRCGAGYDRRRRVVRCLSRRLLPALRRLEQRPPDHGDRRRRLDQQPASLEAGGLGAHLCPHRNTRPRDDRLVRRTARGTGVRLVRPASRADDRWPDAG